MRTMLLILLIALCPAVLLADDGSWSKNYNLSQGILYSTEEHPDIALEKEFLGLRDFESGSVQAAFLFRNTKNAPVTTLAGFPVEVRFSAERVDIGKGTFAYVVGAGDTLRACLTAAGFTLTACKGEVREYGSHYIREADFRPFRKELPVKSLALPELTGFSIKQDGRPVAVDSVVIELKTDGDARLIFHYRHRLRFGPSARSVVRVDYRVKTFSGTKNVGPEVLAPEYIWNYILETGATWKGPIGTFILGVPAAYYPQQEEIEKLSFLGVNGTYCFFGAENLEPVDTNLRIAWADTSKADEKRLKRLWFGDSPESINPPERRVSSIARLKGASSFLNEKADVYLANGVLKGCAFTADKLIDGLAETAWCEGAKGDGIGEWVDWEFTADVSGMRIQNGFLRAVAKISGKDIHTYYEKNNRVKTLEFVSEDQTDRRKVAVADRRDFQWVPLDLPKGRYRMLIGDVYRGSKYADTCIGEIEFFPVSPLLKKAQGDPFFGEFLR